LDSESQVIINISLSNVHYFDLKKTAALIGGFRSFLFLKAKNVSSFVKIIFH